MTNSSSRILWPGGGQWLPTQIVSAGRVATQTHEKRLATGQTTATHTGSTQEGWLRVVAIGIAALILASSLCLWLGTHFNIESPWINSRDDFFPSIGGIAFCLGGVWAIVRKGGSWPLAILCGESLFCFGGGWMRDVALLHSTPWMFSSLPNVIQMQWIALIATAFIVVRRYMVERLAEYRKQHDWRNYRILDRVIKVSICALVICDTYGLYEFAQGGQAKAALFMASVTTQFLGGWVTQIGGGVFAIIFRTRYFKIPPRPVFRSKIPYYVLAAAMNGAYLVLNSYGVSENLMIWLVLLPSILVALVVDGDSRDIIFGADMLRYSSRCEHDASEAHFIRISLKELEQRMAAKLRIYLLNQRYSRAQFHRRQGRLA